MQNIEVQRLTHSSGGLFTKIEILKAGNICSLIRHSFCLNNDKLRSHDYVISFYLPRYCVKGLTIKYVTHKWVGGVVRSATNCDREERGVQILCDVSF